MLKNVLISLIIFVFIPDFKYGLSWADSLSVDFSYSPPEWQTAICLPDDRHKSLVDKSGELLYHYGYGAPDFATRIAVQITREAAWCGQQLYSPRIPIVITYRNAPGVEIVEEAFAITDLTGMADPLKDDVLSAAGPPRNDIMLIHVTNSGNIPQVFHPRLIVNTRMDLRFAGQKIIVNKHNTLFSSLKISGPSDTGQFELESITVPAGKTLAFFILYTNGEPMVHEPATLAQAYACRDQAVNYWETIKLPYGRIKVPDPGIQNLIDAAIRNIWQAREIKKGLPAFQVGPTCYRGLWIVDGAFLLEAATILGAGQQARNGVAFELTYQQPDGRIQVMKNYSKENGIVIWTCVRHARLTQDKNWLKSVWPNLEKIARHIRELRLQTRINDSSLDDGLVPAGFPDGGIGGIHDEYTNAYWNLIGLYSFIEGAHWLGNYEQAAEWQQEYDNFMLFFRVAALRDSRFDAYGNWYLPTLMDGEDLPQRGQWAFCHAVYPGQLFDKEDPLVKGNLEMLAATEHEDLVYGTGWDATGIWNYFASFYAHAWLWQGEGYKAAQTLYAFANHASPLLAWREEQSLKGASFKKVGDMPHNWASAEFIRLAVHLLALDRGNELHLFEGLPAEWTRPGMCTRLTNISTPFGFLRLELSIDATGRSARLELAPLYDNNCKAMVVHLSGWASADSSAVLELDPRKKHILQIPLYVPPHGGQNLH